MHGLDGVYLGGFHSFNGIEIHEVSLMGEVDSGRLCDCGWRGWWVFGSLSGNLYEFFELLFQ